MSNNKTEKPVAAQPGEGIRSLPTTKLFKVINYELYVKPNILIMTTGLIFFGAALGYMAYMRAKYESQGYYVEVKGDGNEIYAKKKSKWND